MNDFNILAVHNNLDELEAILTEKENAKDFVLIDGCVSKLKIGFKEVPIQFDKMLYSCDENILILIMKNSKIDVSNLEELMHKRNMRYSKYTCDKQNNFYKSDAELKEFSFAGDKNELKKAINNSKANGANDCVYYPNVGGMLELGYLTDEKYGLFGRIKLDGVIDFDDQMILLLGKQKTNNLNDRQLFDILMDTSIRTLVDVDVRVHSFKHSPKAKSKQLVKN